MLRSPTQTAPQNVTARFPCPVGRESHRSCAKHTVVRVQRRAASQEVTQHIARSNVVRSATAQQQSSQQLQNAGDASETSQQQEPSAPSLLPNFLQWLVAQGQTYCVLSVQTLPTCLRQPASQYGSHAGVEDLKGDNAKLGLYTTVAGERGMVSVVEVRLHLHS